MTSLSAGNHCQVALKCYQNSNLAIVADFGGALVIGGVSLASATRSRDSA